MTLMYRVGTLFVVLLVLSLRLDAASILSVTSSEGSPVLSIDSETGLSRTILNTDANATIGSLFFGVSAFDPAARRLFFSTRRLRGGLVLITADLVAKTITVQQLPLNDSIEFFEWDAATQKIVAATTAAGAPLVTISPSSGSVQTVVDTHALVSGAPSAIDASTRHLYFLTGSNDNRPPQVVTVDLTARKVESHPIDTVVGCRCPFIEWDPVTRMLIAVSDEPGTPVVSIDPATGSVHTLLKTNVVATALGPGAFDPASRQVYFKNGGIAFQRLVVADLRSRSVSSHSIAIAAAYDFFELDVAAPSVPALRVTGLVLLAITLGACGLLAQGSGRSF